MTVLGTAAGTQSRASVPASFLGLWAALLKIAGLRNLPLGFLHILSIAGSSSRPRLPSCPMFILLRKQSPPATQEDFALVRDEKPGQTSSLESPKSLICLP